MTPTKGFWSYVHKDDEAEGGRVTDLARDVVAAYEMLTGESIHLFLDKDTIEWGDAWKEVVDESLSSVAFFIPVLSPRYFLSAECRRELQRFARRATSLGVKELVLPLLYVDVADIHADEPEDELVALVKDFHREDWTDLRFESRASSVYRRGVARLAQRLVAANQAAESADIVAAAEALAQEATGSDDDEPGVIDRIAGMEEAMPEWAKTVEAIGKEIEALGRLMQDATSDIHAADSRGKGMAGRLTIARQMAKDLKPRSQTVLELGSQFSSQMHAVDQGVRTLIQHLPEEAETGAKARTVGCEFFHSVREMAHAAGEGLADLQSMIDSIEPLEGMSRDLRPPIRALRKGLTAMLEAREVTEEWVTLIEASPLDC